MITIERLISPAEVSYGIEDTVYGRAVVASCGGSVCVLQFAPESEAEALLGRIFPGAAIVRRDEQCHRDMAVMVSEGVGDVTLKLSGTDFQMDVWRRLAEIPRGELVRYGDIARAVGRPRAHRAVGSAVGANPVAVVIPCHRVTPASGGTGNYRWGCALKERLIAEERL